MVYSFLITQYNIKNYLSNLDWIKLFELVFENHDFPVKTANRFSG